MRWETILISFIIIIYLLFLGDTHYIAQAGLRKTHKTHPPLSARVPGLKAFITLDLKKKK